MNRKKAILLLSGLETFLLAMLAVLFTTGAIGLEVFLALVVLIAVVSSTVLLVVIRKLS